MKNGFRASMAWLHTWAGLVVGWLLFAVFLTGTASYFRDEITQWTRPELPHQAETTNAAAQAIGWLQQHADGARAWTIELPHDRDPAMSVLWRDAVTKRFERRSLDPARGTPLTLRATRGGDFFYYFHFDLMLPSKWGRILVGIAAMSMFVAIISGVVTHRRIFKDFFTFRPGPGQRAWLDAHNVLGVLALPYHLMITYTGLITLMFLYMPFSIDIAYPGARQAFNEDVFLSSPAGAPSGVAAPLTALAPLLETTNREWHGGSPGLITISLPGDSNARVQIFRNDADRVSVNRQAILFNGVNGRILEIQGSDRWIPETRGVLYGLHLARFSGTALRWLFFLSGLAGTAMVATGLVLWTVKRRPAANTENAPNIGLKIVESLNIAAIAGLPLAMAAFFLANRVLPLDMSGRAAWEVKVFFLIWLCTLVWAAARPAERAWIEILAAAALAYLAVPIVNAATTSRNLIASITADDWVFAGVDLTLLTAGLCLAWAALKLSRRRVAQRTRPMAARS